MLLSLSLMCQWAGAQDALPGNVYSSQQRFFPPLMCLKGGAGHRFLGHRREGELESTHTIHSGNWRKKYSLGINPETGSKSRKKRINPHVSSLVREVIDFDWMVMTSAMQLEERSSLMREAKRLLEPLSAPAPLHQISGATGLVTVEGEVVENGRRVTICFWKEAVLEVLPLREDIDDIGGSSHPGTDQERESEAQSPSSPVPLREDTETSDSDDEDVGAPEEPDPDPAVSSTAFACPRGPGDISRSKEESPVQPCLTNFPRKQHGQRRRAFCSAWYTHNSWLEYSILKDSSYCFAC
ncbi:hypothetical protein INR49_004603 [Caranx melampygus]|nr:hypothetical protein INR49_004603 [Caranx melampygus]